MGGLNLNSLSIFSSSEMKKLLLNLFLFLLLPGLVLDVVLRIAMPFPSTKGYGRVLKDVHTRKINFLFVGSSRVGAAINSAAFDNITSKAHQKRVRSENLGMGSSTLVGHYYGLKAIFDASMHDSENCHMFVEVTLGLPPMDTWEGIWFNAGQYEQLYPYIDFSDYLTFWQVSGNSINEKVTLGLLKAFRPAGFLLSARSALLSRGEVFTQRYISSFADNSEKENPGKKQAPMHMAAGIRNDPAGIKLARELILKQAAKSKGETNGSAPFADWEKLVLVDMRNLAEKNHCTMSLVSVPLSPSQELTRKSDRSGSQVLSFKAWARQNQLPILSTGLHFTDDDYPDLWHLSADKALIFSEQLARAYAISNNPAR